MAIDLGRNIPLQIQRQLRKECFFGCALCGSPLIKYAHIVPYSQIQAFLPENMISLCPLHYDKYGTGSSPNHIYVMPKKTLIINYNRKMHFL